MAASTSSTDDDAVSNKVEINSRIAQWTVHTNMQVVDRVAKRSSMDKPSHLFKIGKWNWKLYFVNSVSTFVTGGYFFGLDPVKSNLDPIVASFSIRVLCKNQIYKTTRQTTCQGKTTCQERYTDNSIVEVQDADKMFYSDKVYWKANLGSYTGEFIVEVEFFELKTMNYISGEMCSIWSRELSKKELHQNSLIASVGRMLSENIHIDVTINTSDGGKFSAHRAILASRSSVFRSMFSHDLQEKELSTITMSDISTGACKTLLEYIYGKMKSEDLRKHLCELLRAAHKYDLPELLQECVERLTDNIDKKNVLESLQTANLYGLPKLKSTCLKYLVKSRKIFEINKDDFDEFLQNADKEQIVEIFGEILKEWKMFRNL